MNTYINKTHLGIAVVSLLINWPVFAAESWRAMPNTNSNILFSIDENSLIKKDNIVRFTEKLVYVVPEIKDSSSGKMVKEKVVYRVMHCKDNTQAYLRARLIDVDNKLIEEQFLDEEKLSMVPVPPGSLADIELKWACGKGKQWQ